MRLELTCVGLLVQLANRYTTRGALYVPIVELLEDPELTCELCEIDRIERVLPLYLKGPARETYRQLSKEQRCDGEEINLAFIIARGMDSFVAFDHIAMRQLRPGETENKFLTELQSKVSKRDAPRRLYKERICKWAVPPCQGTP